MATRLTNVPNYQRRKQEQGEAGQGDSFAAMRRAALGDNPGEGAGNGPASNQGAPAGGNDDLDGIDLDALLNDGDDNGGDDNGGQPGGQGPSASEVALQAQLLAERQARERLEGESRQKDERLSALATSQQELNQRLEAMQTEALERASTVTIEPPTELVEAIGEEAARKTMSSAAEALSKSQAQVTKLVAQNQQIMGILEKAGISDGASIVDLVDQRVQSQGSKSWEEQLEETSPVFLQLAPKPAFKQWARETMDGVNSVMENIAVCIERKQKKDIPYFSKVVKMYADSRGATAIRTGTHSSSRPTRGAPSGRPREESASEANKRKAEARRKASGWR